MQQLFTVLKIWISVILLTCIAIIGTYQEAKGTHAMGSDLQYECLGGDTYRIRLTIYRACEGSALNQTQNIGFQSTSCSVPRFIQQAPRVSITEISPLCPSQQPNSTCNGGLLPGIEEHVYELIHEFPAQCNDWQISWHLCCRNLSITNSVITNDTRMYIEAYLNNLDVSCNNSPFFTTPPVPYLCDGQPFSFNNGAVDPDGDSLGFELVNPLDFIALQQQITQVPYVTGFSPTYPMATSPPQTFNFSPVSGQISFTPSGLQQGIVALLVTEYRNGVPIGSTMRDLQMVVINCANEPPVIDPPFNITGGQFDGNTFSVCAGDTLEFDLSGFDINTSDALTVDWFLGQTGADFGLTTTPPNNPWNGNFDWPTDISDIGTYNIVFQVEDDGCPIKRSTSVGYQIVVGEGEILPTLDVLVCTSDTSISSVQIDPGIPLGPGGVYTWEADTALSSTSAQMPFVDINAVPGSFTVTYSQPNQCDIVRTINVRPELELVLTPDTVSVCLGDSVQLGVNVVFNGSQSSVGYLWSPSGTLSNVNVPDPIATPTAPGTIDYNVLVSTFTCTYSASVHVIVDQAPSLTVPPPQNICAGNSTVLNASGTNLGSASYSWSPILGLSDPTSLTPTASPGTSTTYTLTATNSCGTDAGSVPVNVAPGLSLGTSVQDVNCAGGNDGSINVVAFGGGGLPITYTWDPNVVVGNSPTATNLGAGTYEVLVEDGFGCIDSITAIVNEPPPLVVSIDNLTNIDCFNGATGTITASATGGTPGYEYSLDGVTFYTLNTFINLPAGPYSVTVRDANGCTETSAGFNLTQPALPVVGNITNVVNTNCNTALGAIDVTVTGGSSPYTYTLNNDPSQLVGNFTGLTPGLYQIIIADSLGCSDTVSTEIIEVADPFLVIDSTSNTSCFASCDGTIEVSPVSGTGPYQFQLNGMLPFTTDSVFTGLCAGYYEVGLVDGNGCRYNLNVFINEPDSLYGIVGAQTDVFCNGGNDGSATVLGYGGVGGFTYGVDSVAPFSSAGVSFQPGSGFALSAGPHVIYIQDANNCIAEVPVTIGEPSPILGSVVRSDDVSCFGLSDGSFAITGTGGTPGYSYSFEDVNGPYLDSGVYVNLSAGTYEVFIQDDRGCLDSAEVMVEQPDPLGVELSDLTNVLCFETATGTISVVGSGGTAPYEFAFDSLTYTSSPTDTGLAVGDYVILIRDANGCEAQTEATILQPPPLLGEIESQQILCFGDENGTTMTMVSGGTAPFTYDWGEPSFTPAQNASPNLSNLPAGNYSVLVVDANGCEITMSTEIIEPPRMYIDSAASMDVNCHGDSSGMASIIVVGGNAPYSYNWRPGGAGLGPELFNLPAGSYDVTAMDTNGCTVDTTFLLTQPEPLEIGIIDIGDAFCGLPTGSITIEVIGGIEDYQILWETGDTTLTAVDLFGGRDYNVSILDMNGCPASYK